MTDWQGANCANSYGDIWQLYGQVSHTYSIREVLGNQRPYDRAIDNYDNEGVIEGRHGQWMANERLGWAHCDS